MPAAIGRADGLAFGELEADRLEVPVGLGDVFPGLFGLVDVGVGVDGAQHLDPSHVRQELGKVYTAPSLKATMGEAPPFNAVALSLGRQCRRHEGGHDAFREAAEAP